MGHGRPCLFQTRRGDPKKIRAVIKYRNEPPVFVITAPSVNSTNYQSRLWKSILLGSCQFYFTMHLKFTAPFEDDLP